MALPAETPTLVVDGLQTFFETRAGMLKAVDGVSEGLAQKVYDFFHEKG